MSVKIIKQTDRIILRYEEEFGRGAKWLDDKLESDGGYTFRRTFTATSNDRIPIDENEDANTVRHFQIGTIDRDYNVIYKKALGIKYDLLIHESIKLDIPTFVAVKDISVFSRIDNLTNEQIIVGGSRDNSIPEHEFICLLKLFPTTTELSRYAEARISNILGDFLETMTDAESKLSKYFERKQMHIGSSVYEKTPKPIELASELELEKQCFILDRLKEMLNVHLSYSEKDWQKAIKDLLLLMYPQYIVAVRELPVQEWYSKQFKMTKRSPDFTLINYAGNVDIIEIKKPEAPILRKGVYRDNYIPSRDLSGTIMQAEKYVFYLNKGGRELESSIKKKYNNLIPTDLKVKIASPKAIVLLGRDNEFSESQQLDLEIIKRKYANIIDIVTYDDLLKRLQNVISVLRAARLSFRERKTPTLRSEFPD